jgi:hypothetical protein
LALLLLLLMGVAVGGPTSDAYDLGVLMEVAELYCVANPIDGTHEIPVEDVCYMAWQPLLSALTNALAAADAHVPTAFAATCGEALFSIAEYLVEDVLLVMVGEGPGAGNSADWTSSSSSRTGAASASTTSAASTSSSSSSSAQKLVTGGDNIFVTADDRLAWTRDVATVLGLLLAQQQTPLGTPQSQTGEQEAGWVAPVLRRGQMYVILVCVGRSCKRPHMESITGPCWSVASHVPPGTCSVPLYGC